MNLEIRASQEFSEPPIDQYKDYFSDQTMGQLDTMLKSRDPKNRQKMSVNSD